MPADLGGGSPSPNLIEVKGSEAQGPHREEGRAGCTPSAHEQLFRHPRPSTFGSTREHLTLSNRRGTDPYARWCRRGGAVRRPPIRIWRSAWTWRWGYWGALLYGWCVECMNAACRARTNAALRNCDTSFPPSVGRVEPVPSIGSETETPVATETQTTREPEIGSA